MANDEAEPASKGRSLSGIAAIAAVGVTISAAALYSFGVAYQNKYLTRLGFYPSMFPADFYWLTVRGAFLAYPPVYILVIGGVIGGALVLLALAKVSGWLRQRRLAWRRNRTGDEKPPDSEKLPAPASEPWRNPLLIASSIMMAWGVWAFLQELNTRFAQNEAEKDREQFRNAPWGKPDFIRDVGLALERGDGELVRQPGWLVLCSERFCGLHDGRNPTVVSLEGVKRMRTEPPAGCQAPSPGSTEKSSPDS